MINSRLVSLIRKEFIQIVRDPRTLVLILFIPIMQLFLMGYAATTDVRNVSLVVFDQDRGMAARQLLDAYRAADYFKLAYEVDSREELIFMIDSGKARVGLIIPPGYSDAVMTHESAQVMVLVDGSDPTVASTALSAAMMIGQEHATQVLLQRLQRFGSADFLEPPVEVRAQVWYNPDLVSSYFMIPGVIAMILFALTSILTATAVVRERERGTIEQLIVTPIRPWELVVGKLLPYVILACLMVFEVLAIGHYWFQVPIRSSPSLILLVSGVFLLTSLGIGLFASTVANTQQEAMLIVWMTLLPSLFLSGFFFPIEAMPRLLQWVSYAVPLRYYLVIIRALMIKGANLAMIQNEVIALLVFGALMMTAAALRFRKRLD